MCQKRLRDRNKQRQIIRPMVMLAMLPVSLASAQSWHGEDAFLSEMPVVLTVTRLPQSIRELPAAVTVIDRHMIEASGAVELTDLFRLVPGFQVGYYHGAEGSRTIVTSHGYSDQFSRRMQVMIDGRSVYKPATGGAEWQDLPLLLDDIERIEVIRGPNAVSYGANAMVGIINIITRHPSNQQGNYLSTTVGQRGYRQVSARHSEGFGPVHYRISADFTKNPGYEDKEDDVGLADDMLTRGLTFRGDYRAGVNDYITLQLGGSNGDRQAGEWEEDLDPVRYRRMNSDYQQLEWQRILDSDSEISLQYYHDRHDVKDDVTLEFEVFPTIFVDVPNDTSLKSERQNLQLNHRFRVTESMRLAWGAELRQDRVTAATYFDLGESYTLNSRNLSFNLEWKPGADWIINLGNMLEHNDLVGTRNSPRLGINYLFEDGHYIRAARSRAYRMPSLLEEKADYVLRAYNLPPVIIPPYYEGYPIEGLFKSTGDIRPERLDSMEIAFGMETGRVGYDIRLFQNRFRDVVNNAFDDQSGDYLYRISNDGKMDIDGGEAQLRVQTADSTSVHLAFAHAHASGWKVREYQAGGGVETEDMSSTVPETTMGMLLDHAIDHRQHLGMAFYHVSSMRLILGSNKHMGEGINTIDLNYSRDFRLGETAGKWRVLLRDITGSYYTVRRNVWRDSQVFFNLSLNF